MDVVQAQQDLASGSALTPDEIYIQIMGVEHGRLRGFGHGVTSTLVLGKSQKRSSQQIASKISEQFQNVQQQLAELQKERAEKKEALE